MTCSVVSCSESDSYELRITLMDEKFLIIPFCSNHADSYRSVDSVEEEIISNDQSLYVEDNLPMQKHQ